MKVPCALYVANANKVDLIILQPLWSRLKDQGFFYSVLEPLKFTRDTGLLTFRDRFDILLEKRLSGVAKRLIWEMSDDPAPAVELTEDVSVIDAGKLTQQLISN